MNETGLEITFRTLAKSPNRAASRLAISALSAPYFQIRRAAVEANLKRREAEGHLALLERWPTLGTALRGETPKYRHEFVSTLDERLPHLVGELRTHAIEAATFLGACELLPSMIRAATRGTALDRSAAERAAVDLAGILSRERMAAKPRLSQRQLLHIYSRSVAAVKERIRESLDRPDSPLFEILFMLVEDKNWIAATLAGGSDLREPLLAAVRRTRNAAALDRVMDLFANSNASKALAGALAERRDGEFVEATLRALESPFRAELIDRLRASRLLDWLEPSERTLRAVPRRFGPLLLRLAMRLTDHPPRMREILEGFYRVGEPDVRREALRLARRLPPHLIAGLLQEARNEADPQALGDVLMLLREKSSPETFEAAVAALERPHADVLAGLRRALPELTYEALMRRADAMGPDDLKAIGRAVFAVRPEALERLREGVDSGERSVRLRSLRLACSVGVVEEIESSLLASAKESDKFVRAAALEALALCDTEASADALTEALSDELPQIRDLAERLLTERISRPTQLPPPTLRPKMLAAFVAAASQGYGADSPSAGDGVREASAADAPVAGERTP
ncbi:MAG TPA: hypothetical protein VGN57_21415 [Pirellulaceae bacterium]|jgi:hypothetical protein|nr:hypothetical protein [Pirellulaceae bacterium]